MGIDQTIAPKSDQINFDDFGGGPRTIKITGVKVTTADGTPQPVAIHFEGDNGKPYKPSKGMRRVLVNLWGSDEQKYIGRSLTLYGDPTVIFGGKAVGGIRISHMSHIDSDMSMPMTMSKARRDTFTVKKLAVTGAALDPATVAEYERLLHLAPNDIAKKARDYIAKNLTQAAHEKMIARLNEAVSAPKDAEPTAEEKAAIDKQIASES